MPTDLISRHASPLCCPPPKKHRIAIVSDAMLDVYLTGDERVSPEAPVLVHP